MNIWHSNSRVKSEGHSLLSTISGTPQGWSNRSGPFILVLDEKKKHILISARSNNDLKESMGKTEQVDLCLPLLPQHIQIIFQKCVDNKNRLNSD